MRADAMIAACFRHQHPEAFERPEVPEPVVPSSFIMGAEAFTWPPCECLDDPVAHG